MASDINPPPLPNTATGRAVLAAVDDVAARNAIGAAVRLYYGTPGNFVSIGMDTDNADSGYGPSSFDYYGAAQSVQDYLQSHIDNTGNPHGLTIADVPFLSDELAAKQNVYDLQRYLSGSPGSYTFLGNFQQTNGANAAIVTIAVGAAGFSCTRTYHVAARWAVPDNTWMRMQPVASSGPYGDEDLELIVFGNGAQTHLAIRKVAGVFGGWVRATVINAGAGSTWVNNDFAGADLFPTPVLPRTPTAAAIANATDAASAISQLNLVLAALRAAQVIAT